MPEYDSMKKKIREVQTQEGPQQVQAEPQQQFAGRSVIRQYETAMEQEAKLATKLRQGPPDHVLKKGKWKSRQKRALEELREKNRETFGTFLDAKKVTGMNADLRRGRMEAENEGRTWGEQGIVSVFEQYMPSPIPVSGLVKDQAPVSGAFAKLCQVFDQFQQRGAVTGEIAGAFLELQKEEGLQFGPAARFLTGDNAQNLSFGGFLASEKPEVFRMVMQNCLTTALFHCMDQMDVSQIDVEAFAALRTAAMTSEAACAELLNNPEFKEASRQKQLQEKEKEEARKQEEALRQENERKQKEELERQRAEREQHNRKYMDKFLGDGDRYSAGWAKEHYPEWLEEALKDSMDQNPEAFALQLARFKENLDARLAELKAFAEQHEELTLGMPMLSERISLRLAALAGAKKLCGGDKLSVQNLQTEEQQLKEETSQERAQVQNRQDVLKKAFPELSQGEWKNLWENPQLQKLILHTEKDNDFSSEVEKIKAHAALNETVLRALIEERGLTAGADSAITELRRKLGAKWMLGAVAAVRIESELYIDNLNTYAPEAFHMEQNLKKCMKQSGFPEDLWQAAYRQIRGQQFDFSDEKSLESRMALWKETAETNRDLIQNQTNKRKLTRGQWDAIRNLEQNAILLDPALLQKELDQVYAQRKSGTETMTRDTYLYGAQAAKVKTKTGVYQKLLETKDLCECKAFEGLLSGQWRFVKETLEELLKSGALKDQFPFLKQIKHVESLDRLDYSQYEALSGFLRDNMAKGLKSWSQIRCADQQTVKEQLLKNLMLGTYTEEVVQQTVEKHQQALEESGKVSRMKLLSILGTEQEEQQPLALRYMKTDADNNIQGMKKRLERIRIAHEMWDELKKNGQDQRVLYMLSILVSNFTDAKKIQNESDFHKLKGDELRRHMSEEILDLHNTGLYRDDSAMREVEKLFRKEGEKLRQDRGIFGSVSSLFTDDRVEAQSSLILEFLMCGMEQELMAPGTYGEQFLYRGEDASYDEGLSILTVSAVERLAFLEKTARYIYGSGSPEAEKNRSSLMKRLQSTVLLMEPVPGSAEPLSEEMRKRNKARFGVESLKELYEQVNELVEQNPQKNLFELEEVREAADLCRERKQLLIEHNNWSIALLLPYMTRDSEVWTHMMLDDEASFLQFAENWKQSHPALEVLKDAPEVYASQFVAERAGEILSSTEGQAYWKKELDSFVQLFDNRKVGGQSINERLEALDEKKYKGTDRQAFFVMIEAQLRSSSEGFEALYDDEKLAQLFGEYEKQYEKNIEALNTLMKENDMPEKEQKLFAMQLGTVLIKEAPETFEKELNSRYLQFQLDLRDREKEKEEAARTEQMREQARAQIEQMRKEGNAAIRTNQDIMEKLRGQYWKSGSVLFAAEGIQKTVTETEAKKAEQSVKEKYGRTYAKAVTACLAEISLANPELKEKELGERAEWLQKMSERIQTQKDGKDSGEAARNGLLLYAYLHSYQEGQSQPDEGDFARISQEWLARRSAVTQIRKQFSEVHYASLTAEIEDLLHCMQMGIFTLDNGAFESLVKQKQTYFENADRLYAMIDEMTDESLQNYSREFREQVRAGLRECLGSYTAGNIMDGEQKQKIRGIISDCLKDQNKFRYLIQSDAYLSSVRWDDLKAKEKRGAAVNRKDLENLISDSMDQKLIGQYNQLNEDQRRLFALALMMSGADQNTSLFSAQLASELQEPEHTADWFIEQVNDYVTHKEFAPEVDYGAALERLRQENGRINKDIFEQVMNFTQLAVVQYQNNVEKDWNRMSAGIPSIEAAGRLKNQKLSENRLQESRKTMETAQSLKTWMQEQAKTDAQKDILEKLAAMKPAAFTILIRVLQDRTVLDETTGVSILQMAGGTTLTHANEEGRQELIGNLTGEERSRYLAEADSEESCTQAMRSLLSFQLRDDVDLRGRNLNLKDFKSGVLNRKTLVDWDLLKEALSLTEEVENTMLKLSALRASSKIIEMVPNERAKAGYKECQEHKITSQESFAEYIRKQAAADEETNKDVPALMAGFLSLSDQEKKLFIRALKHRDILDVSRKNVVKSAFGFGGQEFVNEEERNQLADAYIQNSYSETDIISAGEADYVEAMNSLFSTQISDDINFAEAKDTGLEQQRAYEAFSLNQNWSVETVRKTAIDWTLFSRALQFVNRTSTEAQILQQDREIYYSMGNLLKNGKFETDTAFMRKNLHKSGNRYSRFIGQMFTGQVKDKIPFSDLLQKALIAGTAAVSKSAADKLLQSDFVEVEEETDWIDTAQNVAEKSGVDKKKVEYVGQYQAVTGIYGNLKGIYDKVNGLREFSADTKLAKESRGEDLEKQKEAEENQTQKQKERSQAGLARNEKGLEAAGTQVWHDQIHQTVDDVLEVVKTGIALGGGESMEGVVAAIEVGMQVAHFLHQIYTDGAVLEKYLSLSTGQNQKLQQFKENLTRTAGFQDTYSDTSLYEKAMGFEDRTELVQSVVLEIVRSILFSASRFNSQKSLRIQAIATMTVLGFQDDIGKTDSETAEKIYQALSGDAYK